jgi:hypothetical protein
MLLTGEKERTLEKQATNRLKCGAAVQTNTSMPNVQFMLCSQNIPLPPFFRDENEIEVVTVYNFMHYMFGTLRITSHPSIF